MTEVLFFISCLFLWVVVYFFRYSSSVVRQHCQLFQTLNVIHMAYFALGAISNLSLHIIFILGFFAHPWYLPLTFVPALGFALGFVIAKIDADGSIMGMISETGFFGVLVIGPFALASSTAWVINGFL